MNAVARGLSGGGNWDSEGGDWRGGIISAGYIASRRDGGGSLIGGEVGRAPEASLLSNTRSYEFERED